MYSIKKITVCYREPTVVRVDYGGSVESPMRPLYDVMESVEAESVYNPMIIAVSS